MDNFFNQINLPLPCVSHAIGVAGDVRRVSVEKFNIDALRII